MRISGGHCVRSLEIFSVLGTPFSEIARLGGSIIFLLSVSLLLRFLRKFPEIVVWFMSCPGKQQLQQYKQWQQQNGRCSVCVVLWVRVCSLCLCACLCVCVCDSIIASMRHTCKCISLFHARVSLLQYGTRLYVGIGGCGLVFVVIAEDWLINS